MAASGGHWVKGSFQPASGGAGGETPPGEKIGTDRVAMEQRVKQAGRLGWASAEITSNNKIEMKVGAEGGIPALSGLYSPHSNTTMVWGRGTSWSESGLVSVNRARTAWTEERSRRRRGSAYTSANEGPPPQTVPAQARRR